MSEKSSKRELKRNKNRQINQNKNVQYKLRISLNNKHANDPRGIFGSSTQGLFIAAETVETNYREVEPDTMMNMPNVGCAKKDKVSTSVY